MAVGDDWLSYWATGPAICVNQRHRSINAALLANGMAAELARFDGQPPVLDFGCGDTPVGNALHAAGYPVTLYDASPVFTEHNRRAYAGTGIRVAATLAEAAAVGPYGAVLLASVIQYLTPPQLGGLLAELRAMLADGGIVVLTDVIPPGNGLAGDLRSSFGGALMYGYLADHLRLAFARLVTHGYVRHRRKLGLNRYDGPGLDAIGREAGFSLEGRMVNYGILQNRQSWVLRKCPTDAG